MDALTTADHPSCLGPRQRWPPPTAPPTPSSRPASPARAAGSRPAAADPGQRGGTTIHTCTARPSH